LNMDEKRKLEKLLLADVDAAVALYQARPRDICGFNASAPSRFPISDEKRPPDRSGAA
jgi:hypothetical protein